MKVLFTGHFSEGTGYSRAVLDYILALDSVGVDIVCRQVKLNNAQPNLPQIIWELQNKSSKGCNYVIQHVLPHYLSFDGNFKKNIAIFIAETLNVRFSGWPAALNCMDEVWLPNHEIFETCKNSGIVKPQKLVPHAVDDSIFTKEYPVYDLPDIIKEKYKFYFISEDSRRKFLSAALVAYFVNFTKNDKVVFIIKSHKSGMAGLDYVHLLQENIKQVKSNLRLYKDELDYAPIYIIGDTLTDEQIYSLHQQCDCYLAPSFGGAFEYSAYYAMGFGNKVIANNVGGMKDYLHDYSGGYLIKNTVEPVVGSENIFEDLFNGFDEWKTISIGDLGKMMKLVYNMPYTGKINSTKIIQKYNYQSIGNRMKELLSIN